MEPEDSGMRVSQTFRVSIDSHRGFRASREMANAYAFPPKLT